MPKTFFKILLIIIFYGAFFTSSIYAEGENISGDNVVIKAFEERKKMIYDFIGGGELNQEINKLQINLNSLNSGEKLNEELKNKLIEDIEKLKENISTKFYNEEDSEKLKEFIDDAEQSIKIKKNLVTKLNEEIEENNLNKEKVNLLLKQASEQKALIDLKDKDSDLKKYYLLIFITLVLIFSYIIINFLSKKDKIDKNKTVYYNFFLIFGYIVFLVWFFFYLHPELLIFIIFISGYLLAINAHLIASFAGSLFVLEKYKIGNIIKYGDFRGQIVKITTINTVLIPVTKEGIFSDKPIIIPNVDLLKNTIIKDRHPDVYINEYELKAPVDMGLDIIKLVESIENNILIKHLHFRLNTLAGSEESFRTSIGFDNLGKILITFTWRGDDILNKRIE